ncbi:pentapeptide repeat-containing protein [Microcoleus sp. herbarium14]
MKSVTFGAVSLGLIFGLATAVIAANPQQFSQLRQTNQCPGCDLRSIPLPQASLANANLQGADLRGANLREANASWGFFERGFPQRGFFAAS